jgi:hypothetical protein
LERLNNELTVNGSFISCSSSGARITGINCPQDMTDLASLLLVLLALSAPGLPILTAGPAHASADTTPHKPPISDHDWARDAVRSGTLMPLTGILRRMEAEFLGQVLEIELEKKSGRLVYEIDLLSPRGHTIELVYDATTGHLLRAEGRGLEAARRQASPLTRMLP